jgi:HK97 family phage major capsid protein
MPVTADKQIRDRLKETRDQLADLRQRRADAKKERDSAKGLFANAAQEPGVKLTDMSEFKAAEDAVRKVGLLDDEINDLRETESQLLGLVGDSPDPLGVNGASPSLKMPRQGWDGQRLLQESESYLEARSRGVFTSSGHFGTVVLGEIAAREDAVNFLRSRMLAAAIPTAPPAPATGMGTPAGLIVPPEFRGVIPPALLNLSLLDIIPTGTTDSNLVHYVQVTGVPGYAAETPELSVKPAEGISFLDAQAPVVTIAGYLKVSRQAMDDMAGLATMVNTLLPYDVRRRLLNQILAGNGTGGNLLGIYNTTGIGAPAVVGGDNVADAILRAITVIVLSDCEPNFVALNPQTWQDLVLTKTTYGSYVYGEPGQLPGGMVNQTVWGLNITANRLVPVANPLVGDAMSASVLVREGVNVKTSDADQDDFVRNRVTVLAETRVAFPVWRPVGFAIAAQG